MKPLNPTFAGTGTTIFTVMSALANQHGAVNLGQAGVRVTERWVVVKLIV